MPYCDPCADLGEVVCFLLLNALLHCAPTSTTLLLFDLTQNYLRHWLCLLQITVVPANLKGIHGSSSGAGRGGAAGAGGAAAGAGGAAGRGGAAAGAGRGGASRPPASSTSSAPSSSAQRPPAIPPRDDEDDASAQAIAAVAAATGSKYDMTRPGKMGMHVIRLLTDSDRYQSINQSIIGLTRAFSGDVLLYSKALFRQKSVELVITRVNLS
jgi:hypothetical protein